MKTIFRIAKMIFRFPASLILSFIIMLEAFAYRNKNKEVDFNELFGFFVARLEAYSSVKYYYLFDFIVNSLIWLSLYNLIT